MKTAELRKKYLEFYKNKESKYFSSASLVPADDPTLLFTSAGMNQFKDYFLGKNKSATRATSCQKCLRTGDLERVGKTKYHHTFFEMLGNFSFGDYFKKEAIAWAWEFITVECKLDPKDLWVTVFTDDDESAAIWQNDIGVAADKIVRYGSDDNFWPQNALENGTPGPCGPCSEIYYDYGVDVGCDADDCGPACNCGRFVEVWNLVFTQYNCTGVNQKEPLPMKNIDTGMGLERMAGVLQGKTNNYDIDILKPIMDKVQEIIKSDDVMYLRAITDHARALTFCINDGIYPSNEDRGYVVRKILRRALWFGFVCGKKEPFIHTLIDLVISLMEDQYPELRDKQATIEKVVLSEEERFLTTLDKGKEMLFSYIDVAKKENRTSLSGEEVFKLYDTYGFPFELTANIAGEKGVQIDVEGFQARLEQQKEQSRASSKFEDSVFVSDALNFENSTDFVGYDKHEDETAVVNIVSSGAFVDSCTGQERISIVLEKTPFYATKGGQVHDEGTIKGDNFEFHVDSVEDVDGAIVHHGELKSGEVSLNAKAVAVIDSDRRAAIKRAHTTTHILQAALRDVLGDHVQQQGSFVDQDYLRFDFNHFKGLTPAEIAKVEDLVNENILSNFSVQTEEMTAEEAKDKGALAFFEEKYADVVRVVSVGGVSTEFCGGTHLDSTSEAGTFIVVSESSVASGIRRIEAYTGVKAFKALKASRVLEQALCNKLKVQPDHVSSAVADLMTIKKMYAKKIDNMLLEKFEKVDAAEIIAKESKEINGKNTIVFDLGDHDAGFLRKGIDIVRKKSKENTVIVGISNQKDKLTINVSRTDDIKDKSCGDIAKAIGEQLGASGGGKDKFGFCGMKQESKADKNKLKQQITEAITSVL